MAEHDYSQDYLTTIALSAGTISLGTTEYDTTNKTYAYRKNGGGWMAGNTYPSPGLSVSVVAGDSVEWKSVGTQTGVIGRQFYSDCPFNLEGNIMSLAYGDDFIGKRDLEIPRTRFGYLFMGTDVVDAGSFQLPAIYLYDYCYQFMFYGCTSLTTAPEFPDFVSGAKQGCYTYMYYGCTSLTKAPSKLPATVLRDESYYGMFQGCTSLTTAPELPAEEIPTNACSYMFYGCSSLNYIKCLATYFYETSGCYNWVYGVASAGTFVEADSMEDWTIGVHGIPYGWIVKKEGGGGGEGEYISITASNGGVIKWVSVSSAFTTTISYSKDSGSTWTNITSNTGDSAPSIVVNAGDTVLFKGTNLTYSLDSLYYKDHTYFKTNFNYELEGNIMSLVYGDNFSGQTELPQESGFTFSGLFIDNTGLTAANNLSLPATTLSKGCYAFMFQGCSNLSSIPELPATELAESCYYGMFSHCESISSPPLLPATTLAKRCYSYMFGNCSSLTTAPALPVTALTESCYDCMFFKCTSLTTAPELPAEKLVHRCYYYMFAYCSSLNFVKCLAASGFEQDYNTVSWLNGVSISGTFVKSSSGTGWTIGDNGIPPYWTVQAA